MGKATITRIAVGKTHYTIEHSECGGFGVAKDNWPEQVPAPKVGDEIEVFPDMSCGARVCGISVNGRLVFRETPQEIEAESAYLSAQYTADKAKAVYEALRDQRRALERGVKTKQRETICIGGLSPGYEHACQVMLAAGEEWRSPGAGVAWEHLDLNALEKHIVEACPGGPSGAMVGAVMAHLRHIHVEGRAGWLAAATPDRRFTWDGTSGSCVQVCSRP